MFASAGNYTALSPATVVVLCAIAYSPFLHVTRLIFPWNMLNPNYCPSAIVTIVTIVTLVPL